MQRSGGGGRRNGLNMRGLLSPVNVESVRHARNGRPCVSFGRGRKRREDEKASNANPACEREGIVIRSGNQNNNRLSFKAISNRYLLKEK